MGKIDTNLAPSVISAVADALGFHVSFNRSPDTDAWTLATGYGDSYVEHTGSLATVCAFLAGYAEMLQKTAELLNEIDNGNRRLVEGARRKIVRT